MEKNIEQQTWLITGASRGIGRAIAIAAAQKGVRKIVITCSKSVEELEKVAEELKNIGCEVLTFVGNMGDYTKVSELFGVINARFGGVDCLINNAGIAHIGLLSDMTYEEWHRIINTNLDSVFNTSKMAVKYMVSQQFGKIINISSVWGICGASCEVAYSASKGAVNAFTKALAKELAPSNVQVNAIAFGVIDTEMNGHLSKEEKEELVTEIPADRMCKPEEAADFVLRIAESEGYLTGQVIQFDGGWI